METPVMQKEFQGHVLKVYADEEAISPREWDSLGTMVCFLQRYEIGDKHDYSTKDFNSEYFDNFFNKIISKIVLIKCIIIEYYFVIRGFNFDKFTYGL